MRAIGAIVTLLLALAGAVALVGGVGLVATAHGKRAAIEDNLRRALGAFDDAQQGLLQAEGGLASGLQALPVVNDTLLQAAQITRQTVTVLEATEKAGRSLVRGLDTFASEFQPVLPNAKLKAAARGVRAGASDAREALDEVSRLAKTVGPLVEQLDRARQVVRGVESQLRPGAEVLPRLRDRLDRTADRVPPDALADWVLLAVDALGACLALLGLSLLALASTRARLGALAARLPPA